METKPPSSKPSIDQAKKKDDESHQSNRKFDLALDLSLCRNNMDHGFNPKLNEIDQQNMSETHNSDSNSQANNENNEGETRVFSCNYCQRKFYSSQALGGHQNAHKRERTFAKRGQRLVSSTTFGNYYPDNLFKSRSLPSSCSYPNNISGLPLYGYNNHHKPLEIQAHSLIHKPSTNYVPFTSTTSLHAWSRMPMTDQQRAVGRLRTGSSGGSSNSGATVARFDGGVQKKNSQSLERNVIGGACWKSSIIQGSGISNNKQDYDQLHKLDLSLKL